MLAIGDESSHLASCHNLQLLRSLEPGLSDHMYGWHLQLVRSSSVETIAICIYRLDAESGCGELVSQGILPPELSLVLLVCFVLRDWLLLHRFSLWHKLICCGRGGVRKSSGTTNTHHPSD